MAVWTVAPIFLALLVAWSCGLVLQSLEGTQVLVPVSGARKSVVGSLVVIREDGRVVEGVDDVLVAPSIAIVIGAGGHVPVSPVGAGVTGRDARGLITPVRARATGEGNCVFVKPVVSRASGGSGRGLATPGGTRVARGGNGRWRPTAIVVVTAVASLLGSTVSV